MKKERKLVNKTTLYNYGYRKSRIAEEKWRKVEEKSGTNETELETMRN